MLFQLTRVLASVLTKSKCMKWFVCQTVKVKVKVKLRFSAPSAGIAEIAKR